MMNFNDYQKNLSFPNPDFVKGVENIENWIAFFDDFNTQHKEKYAFSWLFGLAILVHSIMPDCSKEIFKEINFTSKEAFEIVYNSKNSVCL